MPLHDYDDDEMELVVVVVVGEGVLVGRGAGQRGHLFPVPQWPPGGDDEEEGRGGHAWLVCRRLDY